MNNIFFNHIPISRCWVICIALICCLPLSAQQQVEYFWDSDPGIGRATACVAENIDNTTGTFQLDLSMEGLTTGLHYWGFRVYNGKAWSSTYTSYIAIPAQTVGAVCAEYFWDTDPGVGKATACATEPVDANGATRLDIPTDALSTGIHLLGIRVNAGGGWSATYTSFVSPKGGKVDYIEYYWDEDPGFGKGTSVSFTPAGDVAITDLQIPTDQLTYGAHTLKIRASSGGIWSTPHISQICKNAIPDFRMEKDTVCVNEEFTLYNLTTQALPDSTRYYWDMNGDGSDDRMDAEDFVYKYTRAGTYKIALGVETEGDCRNTCYKQITVLPIQNPLVTLNRLDATICKDDEATFVAVARNAGDAPTYEWLLNEQVIAGATDDTLRIDSLKHNDKLTIRVYSSYPCSQIEYAEKSYYVTVYDLPGTSLEYYFPVYKDEEPFLLTGGAPQGGTYYIDGVETDRFDPAGYEPGIRQIGYRYTDSRGCTGEAVSSFELKEGMPVLGDVNKDSRVNVMDELCVVDIVYGRKFPTYSLRTADVNGDKLIDVTDIVGIAGIIMDVNSVARQRYRAQASFKANAVNTLAFDDLALNPGDVYTGYFALSCEDYISGAQFDITLPGGVTLQSQSEKVHIGRKPDVTTNTYTILAYSASLDKVEEHLPFLLVVDENMLEGAYPVELSHCVLVAPDMQVRNCHLSAGNLRIGGATSVIGTDAENIRLSVDGHRVVVTGAEGGKLTICDMEGRVLLVEDHLESSCEVVCPEAGSFIATVVTETCSKNIKFVIR